MMWHFAERWGHVSRLGVVSPLPVPQRILAEILGLSVYEELVEAAKGKARDAEATRARLEGEIARAEAELAREPEYQAGIESCRAGLDQIRAALDAAAEEHRQLVARREVDGAVNAASGFLALVAGAVVGGAVWGALAWWTHGVLAPLLCHGVWTGLMLVRPPVRPGTRRSSRAASRGSSTER